MHDLEYAGMLGSTYKVFATDLISSPAAEPNLEEVKLSGRDGTIYRWDGTYKSKQIKIPFNYIGPAERWNDRWRMIKQWLSARNTTLRFSGDSDFFL